MMPRLFVALGDIPQDERIAGSLSRLLARLPGAREVAAEGRHVTLAFLGEVPRGRIGSVEEACRTAARGGRQEEYVLNALGGFPRSEARIVALTGPTPPGLGRLAAALGDLLGAEGFAVERRPLRVHVTVARLRESCAIPAQVIAPLRVMAEEIRLYESELLPAGARYHLVSAFALPRAEGPSA